MFDALINQISSTVRKNTPGIDDEKEEIIRYGLDIFLYNFSVFLFLSVTSLLLGIFQYILIAMLVYGSLRIAGGGGHAKTRVQCVTTSFILLYGSVAFSMFFDYRSFYPTILTTLILLVIALLYAPGDTIERPILSNKIRGVQKIATIIIVLLCFMVSYFAFQSNFIYYRIILYSELMFAIQLSPLGYKILGSKTSQKS
jgi:accessory gene regulator B